MWSQRLIYSCALFFLVGLFLIQTYQCLALYIEEPTYVATHIRKQNKAEFPAMTVCPLTDSIKEQVLKVGTQIWVKVRYPLIYFQTV